MLIDPSTRRPHLQTDIPDDAIQALAPPCSRVYIGSQTGVVVAYLSKSKIQVALYDTTVELNDTYIQGAPPPAVDYGSDVMHPLVRAFHNMRAVAAAVRYIPQPPHEGSVSARAALPKRTLAILKLALKQLWLSPSDALSLRLVSRGLSAAVLGSVDVTVDSDPSEGGTAIPTGLRGVVVGCLNKHNELAQFDISATSKLKAMFVTPAARATVDDSVLQRLCASSLKAPLKRFSLTTLSDANSTPKSRASTMSHTAVAALRARFPSIIEVSIPLGIAYDAVTAGVLTDRSLRVLRVSFLGSVVARGLMMAMPALRTLHVHFHGNVELPPAWCFAAACPLLVDIRLVLSPTFSQGFSIAAVSSCRHLERCALEGWGPDEQSPDVHDHDVSQILLRCSNLTVLELRNLSNVTDAAATLALVSRLKRVVFSSCPKITAVASDYAAFLASTFNELRPLVFKLST